jgi:ribosomal protein L35AE/L33A
MLLDPPAARTFASGVLCCKLHEEPRGKRGGVSCWKDEVAFGSFRHGRWFGRCRSYFNDTGVFWGLRVVSRIDSVRTNPNKRVPITRRGHLRRSNMQRCLRLLRGQMDAGRELHEHARHRRRRRFRRMSGRHDRPHGRNGRVRAGFTKSRLPRSSRRTMRKLGLSKRMRRFFHV